MSGIAPSLRGLGESLEPLEHLECLEQLSSSAGTRVSESATSGIVSVRQKWSEDFEKRRYCLSEASCVSAEIRVTVIFGNARHTAGDFSFVSFLLVMQKKRKTIESLEHLEHLETKQHDRSPPDHNINHHRRTKQRRNSGDRQRIGKQIGDDVAHQKQVGTNQCCGG